jgi:hypothetical protein
MAREGNLAASDLDAQLDSLVRLLPDIAPRLASLKPDILLRLASSTDQVAAKLLELKAVFPSANCGRMLVKELGLMAESKVSLQARSDALRAFLPDADIDLIVQVRCPSKVGLGLGGVAQRASHQSYLTGVAWRIPQSDGCHQDVPALTLCSSDLSPAYAPPAGLLSLGTQNSTCGAGEPFCPVRR